MKLLSPPLCGGWTGLGLAPAVEFPRTVSSSKPKLLAPALSTLSRPSSRLPSPALPARCRFAPRPERDPKKKHAQHAPSRVSLSGADFHVRSGVCVSGRQIARLEGRRGWSGLVGGGGGGIFYGS